MLTLGDVDEKMQNHRFEDTLTNGKQARWRPRIHLTCIFQIGLFPTHKITIYKLQKFHHCISKPGRYPDASYHGKGNAELSTMTLMLAANDLLNKNSSNNSGKQMALVETRQLLYCSTEYYHPIFVYQ